jgi:hypothetical protein
MRQAETVARTARCRVVVMVTLAGVVLAFLGPVGAYDVWWHLRAGRIVMYTGAVPRTDPFSFTAAGRPWTYHSWLAGLALTGAWEAGGTAGLIALRAGLMAAALMLAWLAARRRGVDAGLASVLVLGGALQLKARALARPYVFSFVLFMLFVVVLQDCCFRRRGARGGAEAGDGWLAAEDACLWGGAGRLLLLPLLTVLWANLHAGFISGLLVIGAFGAGEAVRVVAEGGLRSTPRVLLKGADGARFRAMVVAGVLCLAASVVTPLGPDTLLYPFRLLREVKLVKRILEWQPVPLTLRFGVFWAFLGFGALVMLRSLQASAASGRLRREAGRFVTDALLLVGFAFLAVQAARHMAWVLLLAPAAFGWHLSVAGRPGEAPADEARTEPKPLYVLAACVLAFFVGAWPHLTEGAPSFGTVRDKFPEKACDFMVGSGLRNRPYNSYEWGGYLIWRLWPEVRVFIDGRCLVYGDEVIGEAIAVEDAEPGWEQTLERRGVELLLVRHRKKDCSHLFDGARWRCVYWDDAAMIGLRGDLAAARRPALPEFPLSNPVAFEQSLAEADAGAILKELEVVLARDPECWTALGYRARCLVRLAEQQAGWGERLREAAFKAALRASELQEDHHEPWVALQEAAEVTGRDGLAELAARKVAMLRAKASRGN